MRLWRIVTPMTYANGKPLYMCNGKKIGCRKTGCYKIGGDCRMTTNVYYAVPDSERGTHEKEMQ